MGLTRPRAHQLEDSDYKQSVRAVTTTNVTLSGGAPATVDSVSLVTNDRILVTGQTTASENGLYKVSTLGSGSTGTWVRTTDGDNAGDITAGMTVMVTEGSVNSDTQWKLITDDPITIGTTNLTFASISSGGTSTLQDITDNGNSTTNSITVASLTTSGNISGNYITANAFVGGNVTNWNTAYGWGDHSTEGYLTSVAFADLTATPTTLLGYGITDAATSAQGSLADSSIQPGDNISVLTNNSGYITDYTVTQVDVTQHQAALSITESQISDLQSYLTSETVTSISLATNTLSYTDENGTTTDLDLSLYLDDTNLARITSGTVAANGVATFSRDDASTFTVDFSPLLDDTNLTRITSASFNTTNGVLTLTRSDATTVTVDLDNRYLTDYSVTSNDVIQHQANITGTGTLNSGSISSGFGSIDIGTDSITVGSIINANANGVGNIGSASSYFNTVHAKATSAQYADLAENYTADSEYLPGTVVVLAGAAEVTQSTSYADPKVAGVITTEPAHLMNSGLKSDHIASVALIGRVPCRVKGTIQKGDLLVSGSSPGTAQKFTGTFNPGIIIGKALEDYNSVSEGIIEIMIGRI